MKKFEISFRPLAEADLFALYRYIAEEAGHEVAGCDASPPHLSSPPVGGRGMRRVGEAKPSLTRSWVRGAA